jgi:DNA-binding CsgD family transcriptional regulator
MPHPADLRVHCHDGVILVTAGQMIVACYPDGDVAMRNVAVAVARQLGFSGQRVAEVMGLSASYVATLRQRARREGAAGLVRPSGPKPKLSPAGWARAARWRQAGASEAQIAARLGVAQATVSRHLAGAGQRQLPSGAAVPGEPGSADQQPRQPGPLREEPAPEPAAEQPEPAESGPAPEPPAQPGPGAAPGPDPGIVSAAGLLAAGARITGGRVTSRYAGAMLLHAFGARAGAGDILAAAGDGGPGGRRFADVALLSAVSTCFALGAATIEQFKHLTAEAAGPLAGLAGLPGLRTLRPRLAAIADATDPLGLQAMFAKAMLAADPVTSGVYYVDDHFVPYAGAKPVGKGWNNKRGRAEKGRADTHVTAHDGRAVCFTSGEPSGLAGTLPKALAELKRAAPPEAAIMLGFDRGGAYAQVFRHCREENVHWVTYRRAPLAVPKGLPVLTTITVNGRSREVAWAEETVQLKDYGTARQLTLFEHGHVVLQILTSDTGACPAEILTWLKSRWREENFLKYAAENYGIDKICDYAAEIEANTKVIDNPARKAANARLRQADKDLAAAREGYAAMLADPAIPAPAKNARLIPAAQKYTARAEKELARAEAARDKIPAKLPANVIDPHAQVALLRAGRRNLQMVLRLLAHNAEHWLASHLNAYLQDDDEYRAITRETIIRGLAGVITYAPDAITVRLDRPGAPSVARALELLLDEINATPPAIPGDRRPITYHLTPAGQI